MKGLSLFITLLIHHSDSYSDDVRLPPTILSGPSGHQYFKADTNFKLTCSASGIPRPTYEWYKNGRTLNLNVNHIQRLSDGSIVINSAGTTDEGFYQCQAINQYGRALSNMSYWQLAFMARSSQEELVLNVTEGQPFIIQIMPIDCIPKAVYRWERAEKPRDDTGAQLTFSRRIQMAENGDLHFAYALPEDSLNGALYKANAFNNVYDTRSVVSYTKVNVFPIRGKVVEFLPTLSFSSPMELVVLEGETLILKCFFSANPEAKYLWRHPKGIFPPDRYERFPEFSEIRIKDVRPDDAGVYTCTASNFKGVSHHNMKVYVEAAPRFELHSNKPFNVNLTQGAIAIFKCIPYAKPHANIQWYIDGEPISYDDPHYRVSIYSDRTQLQIRDICRDCKDRTSDLMVIQCNASNIHGYAFASGYLNVLKKTKVWIQNRMEQNSKTDLTVSDFDDKPLIFECFIESDPSTPSSLKWIKIPTGERNQNFGGEIIRHSPPAIYLINNIHGGLQLTLSPVANLTWIKLIGRYKCSGSNGYSQDEKIITISHSKPNIENVTMQSGIYSYWWILLLVALILFILMFLTMCICCLCRQKGEVYNVDHKERKNGNNPDKEIIDQDINEYKRPDKNPFIKNSHASLSSSNDQTDDSGSLNDYGDVDTSKFNEDGSFVGAYTPNSPTYSVPKKILRTYS